MATVLRVTIPTSPPMSDLDREELNGQTVKVEGEFKPTEMLIVGSSFPGDGSLVLELEKS